MQRILRLFAALFLVCVVVCHGALVLGSLRQNYACDLDAFLGSAAYLRAGQNPYMYTVLVQGFPPSPNLNAPLSLVFLWPLGKLPIERVYPVWTVTSLLAYFAAMLAACRGSRFSALGVLWSLALVGLWHSISSGQVYCFVSLSLFGALMLADSRPQSSGLLLGALIAVKPNFIMILLVLYVARRARLATYSLIGAALFGLIPVLLWGPRIYLDWLAAGRAYSNPFWGNGSLWALSGRLGFLAVPVVTCLVIAVLRRVRRYQLSVRDIWLVGTCLSLLAAPAAWLGYAVILAPLVIATTSTRPKRVAAALLAIPAYPGLVPDSLFPFLNAGVLMSVSMLCLLVGTLLCGAAHARGCTWLSDMPPRPAAHL